MITTTLNRIRAHSPCGMDPRAKELTGFCKLRDALGADYGDDTPVPFARIVEINGLDDALWCCRAEPQHSREWRLFAVLCARQVEHLMTDRRSRDAMDVAERHAAGATTDAELDAAWDAATDAELTAARDAAQAAARDAAMATARAAAWDAALDAAQAAAQAAARDAALDAAQAAARAAAWAATARAAAWAATVDAQKQQFLAIVGVLEAAT